VEGRSSSAGSQENELRTCNLAGETAGSSVNSRRGGRRRMQVFYQRSPNTLTVLTIIFSTGADIYSR
jgi:hypothetical protein